MAVRVRFDSRRPRTPVCFFERYAITDSTAPMPPCDGRLVRCHLIPKTLLKQTDEYKALETDLARTLFLYDVRSWVWGCGGPMGLSGHHGAFDVAKRIRVPRCVIPGGTEELASVLGLEWFLDTTYGRRACTVPS
jgi:hypothetical protein